MNLHQTIALQQRPCFRRIRPTLPRNRSLCRLRRIGASWFGRLLRLGANWLALLRKLLAFSDPGQPIASARADRGNWAADLTWFPNFYYPLLSMVINSCLKAIFLTN